MRIQKRLLRSVSCLEYFTSNEWTFITNNVLALRNKMSADDQQVLPRLDKIIMMEIFN